MKKKVVIILSCILLLIIAVCVLFFYNKNREKDEPIELNNNTIYDNKGQIIYESGNKNEITEVVRDTVIQGIVELNRNGNIYIFNGQHFGEFGFEMEEYTSANIDDKKQKCIDYFTLEEYNTSYIQEGDILICTGDLYKKGYFGDNDFDTKNNSIIVLKAEDYKKMKNEALSGERTAVITVGEFFDGFKELYLKYNISDKTYQLPFALKINITDDTEIVGNIEKGKKVKVQYNELSVPLDELEIKSIEVFEN